jgi:hypothetical protein
MPMGQLDHGRFAVLNRRGLVLSRDADAGGVEVSQRAQQLILKGNAEGYGAEESADAVVGKVIKGMSERMVIEILR